MASKKIPIDIDIDTKGAKRNVDDLNKSIGNTEEALDDVESAGSQFAKKLISQAEDLEKKFNDAKRTAEVLGNALGPELSAKLGQAHLDKIALDMQRVGLTADDVEADIDQLSAAIKQLDETGERLKGPQKGLDDIDAKAKQVEGTSRAASVGIGGIGGSVSELPGVGNLGAIAESMGQLAEGALEGDINSKQLVGTLGLLGGTAAVMWGVQKAMSSIADTKAFNAKQAEDFKAVIEELGPGIDAVNKYLLQTKEITGRSGGIGPFFEGTKDITSTLIDAGVAFDEFAGAIESGGPKLDLVIDKLKAKREALEQDRNKAIENQETTADLEQRITDLGHAIEITEETHKSYAGQLEDTTAWQDWARESAEKLAGGLRKVRGDADDATTASDNLRSSFRDTTDDFNILTSAIDARTSLRDAQQQFDDLKTKADAAFFAAVSGADNAEKLQREYEQAIDDTRTMVINLKDSLGLIPEEVSTSIQALIDEDKFAEAERRITMIATARQVYVDVIARGGGGIQSGRSHTGSRFAAGESKMVRPDQVFTPDVPGYLHSPAESAAMTSPRSVGDTFNVTLNNNGRDVGVHDLDRLIRVVRMRRR